MARPTKLDTDIHNRIVEAIRSGNYAEPSSRSAGISLSTFYRWLARGEAEEQGPYRDFLEAVREAEATAEIAAVAVLRDAMTTDWRAAVSFLERRYGQRWHRHSHSQPVPVATSLEAGAPDLSNLSSEDLMTLKELLARASQSP